MTTAVVAFNGNRKCPRCRIEKGADSFGYSARDGLQSYCSECNSEQALERYYRDNPNRRRDRRIDFLAKTRQCTKCDQWKPWGDFATNGGKPYPHSRCHSCAIEMHRVKRRKNPTLYALNQRRADLKTKYNLTLEQYEEMLQSQGLACKICKSKRSGRKSGVFLVDHNHTNGKVRGLLCARCNVGLGTFDEDTARFRLAACYIEKDGNIS